MSLVFYTEDEVAKFFKITVGTLRRMRARPGSDPLPFTKVGGRVLYREDTLKKWIDRNTFHDTYEAQRKGA